MRQPAGKAGAYLGDIRPQIERRPDAFVFGKIDAIQIIRTRIGELLDKLRSHRPCVAVLLRNTRATEAVANLFLIHLVGRAGPCPLLRV